jgi:transcriptional regulator with XRE-family HTH domain
MAKKRKNPSDDKAKALAKYLKVSVDEITEERDNEFSHGREEYLVLDDDEADERAEEDIKNTIWAFNADFIAAHSKGDISAKNIRKMQEEMSEDAGPIIEAIIKDMDHFIDDAIKSDGRGHFISSYDGEENEEGKFYIYRLN